jgi:hypothetical protein
MLNVVTLDEVNLGSRTEWRYTLNDATHEDALRLMAPSNVELVAA